MMKRSNFERFGSLFCALVFGILVVLTTIFPNETLTLPIYLTFILMFILMILFTLAMFIWRIKIEGDEINYRNCFGRSKIFTFSMIGKVIRRRRDVGVYSQEDKMDIYSKENKLMLHLYGSGLYGSGVSGIGYVQFRTRLMQEGIAVTEKSSERNKWNDL